MAKTTKAAEPAVGAKVEPKKPKHRSPNYPVVNLKKAAELAKALSDKYGAHQVPVSLVHKLWKYDEGSNSGNRCIAALEAYGLIDETGEGEGRKIALSKTGVRVVGNAPDRAELLRHAALGPKIHKEIMKHYGDAGLPDDELLERYLVWDRPEGQRFNPDFVKGFIKRFRETLEYSGLVKAGATEKNDDTPPGPTAVKVGDCVQWTSQGVDQLPSPARVMGLSDDGEYAFVEGSDTGLPMSELTVVDPPDNQKQPIPPKSPPPPNPFAKSPGRPTGELLKIPVTLPSLKVAWLEIPFPLSEAEYEALSTALTTFKQAMTTTTTT